MRWFSAPPLRRDARSILTAISGYRRGAVNSTRLPLYLAFTPAGTSVQNIEHWVRAIHRVRVRVRVWVG